VKEQKGQAYFPGGQMACITNYLAYETKWTIVVTLGEAQAHCQGKLDP